MAAVTVLLSEVTRVDDAESAVGWNGIGGGQGPSAEGSFPYQGANLVNKKITNSGGVRYDPTADGKTAHDFTNSNQKVWLVKAIVTDYGGLNATDGLKVQIGSSSNAYHEFVIAGSASPKAAYSSYTPRGGHIIIPIDPNVTAFRNSTAGSPNLAAVDHFGLDANFDNSTAKAENVGLDAIDVGRGLSLSGGGGVDPKATWGDFVDFDEGQSANRYGFASSIYNGAVIVAFGRWLVGFTATEFEDKASQIIWPDGLFSPSWSRVSVSLNSLVKTFVDGSTHTSLGTDAGADTRADFIFQGTLGSATVSHRIVNFRFYQMTSAVTADGADIEAEVLTQDGGTITNSTIRPRTAATVAMMLSPTFSFISNTAFVQKGAGHAVEITVPGIYTLNQLTWTGFGADGSDDAAIYNNSGGLVQLLRSGGTVPSIKDGPGASHELLADPVTTQITVKNVNTGAAVQGARVYLVADDGGPLTAGTVIISDATDAAGQISDSRTLTSPQPVIGRVRLSSSPGSFYKTATLVGTIDNNNGLTITVQLVPDE